MYAIRSYYEVRFCLPGEEAVGGRGDRTFLPRERFGKSADFFNKYLGMFAGLFASVLGIQMKAQQAIDARITSYNVCYTKLLRYHFLLEEKRRDRTCRKRGLYKLLFPWQYL